MIRIVENVAIARDTFRLRLGDATLAQAIRPGQFVMIRPGINDATDPLLGRPLALYDVAFDDADEAKAFDVVYLVVGRGTAALSIRRPGERLAVWGPLGNGFGPAPDGPAMFVGGGIGQTPFLALARSWLRQASLDQNCTAAASSNDFRIGAKCSTRQVDKTTTTEGRSRQRSSPPALTLLYGVRTAELLAGVDDFREAGVEVDLATDDGTSGHHGFVTDLLARRLADGERPAKVVGCGPPAMLSSLARLVATYRIPCEVSLENHMACGFGACFSCVAPIRQDDGSTDLRRVCVDGPVVEAERVDWAGMAD